MKKLLCILLSIISAVGIAFAFGGCGEKEIEVRGKYYNLEEAYENGWLNEDDLKSISCKYNDIFLGYEENPYSEMFNSMEELSEEIQIELKKAYQIYLNQLSGGSIVPLEDIIILERYGTYNGNIVISIRSNIIIDTVPPQTTVIGGVIFKRYGPFTFYVYHVDN